MVQYIRNYIEQEKKDMDSIRPEDVKHVVDVLFDAWKEGKQVFIFGNGGSASTASHFACDIAKGTLQRVYDHTEKRFRVISLTDNVALMTAFANDLSYDDMFSQQLNHYVNKGDVVIAISGSGNSPNVIKGVELAKKFGAKTIALLGFDGGKLMNIADHTVLVKSNHYGRVESCHLMVHHLIASYLHERIKEVSEPQSANSVAAEKLQQPI
ncbi:SIS domain-containing protein [Candidatus Woesearchaeota archaeon]|nr:SIS domain-containing protein [Candidatus Woesearchaeota archaeon]